MGHLFYLAGGQKELITSTCWRAAPLARQFCRLHRAALLGSLSRSAVESIFMERSSISVSLTRELAAGTE